MLVTGCTGQDGPYLAGQLSEQGHQVWGLVRGNMSPKWDAVTRIVPGLQLIRGDLLDLPSLQSALREASCLPELPGA